AIEVVCDLEHDLVRPDPSHPGVIHVRGDVGNLNDGVEFVLGGCPEHVRDGVIQPSHHTRPHGDGKLIPAVAVLDPDLDLVVEIAAFHSKVLVPTALRPGREGTHDLLL